MSDGELVVTMVKGLAGRLYLAGHLDRLSTHQTALVREAVALHKQLRDWLATATPCWPLGLPGWEDDVLALGYRGAGRRALIVWTRDGHRDVQVPQEWASVAQSYPQSPMWQVRQNDEGLTIGFPDGPGAAVFLSWD